MIKSDTFFFAACDECGEYGPPEEDEREAKRAALSDGWAVEDARHVCCDCLKERRHTACVTDGTHAPEPRKTYENGTELWVCGSCGRYEFTQPTLKDGAS